MKECVEEFKLELEKIYEEMYKKLDELICNTLVLMSFYDDGEEHFDVLQDIMIEVIQEQLASQFYGSEESN